MRLGAPGVQGAVTVLVAVWGSPVGPGCSRANSVVTELGTVQVTSAVMVAGPPSSAPVKVGPVTSTSMGEEVGGRTVTTEALLARSGSLRPTMVAVASTGSAPAGDDHVVLHPPGVGEIPPDREGARSRGAR